MKTVAAILFALAVTTTVSADDPKTYIETFDYQLEVYVNDEWSPVGLKYCVQQEVPEGTPVEWPEQFVSRTGEISTGLTDKNTRLAPIPDTAGTIPCFERTYQDKRKKTKFECSDVHIDNDKDDKYRIFDCDK